MPSDPGRLVFAEGFFVHMAGFDDVTTTYSSAGEPVGSTSVPLGMCDSAVWAYGEDAANGLIIVVDSIETPAAGLTPATWDEVLRAYNAKTYVHQWSTTLREDLSEKPECRDLGPSYFDGFPAVTSTLDGEWFGFRDWIVNVDSGRAVGVDFLPIAVGNRFAKFYCRAPNCLNNLEVVELVNPATMAVELTLSHQYVLPVSDIENANHVSADGTVFVTSGSDGENLISRGTSLVSGDVLWERRGDTPRDRRKLPFVLVDSVNGVAIVDDQTPESDNTYAGVDLRSGEELFAYPLSSVCEARGIATVVVANGQTVFIDPRSGEQLWFTPAYSECGRALGDYRYYDDAIVRVVPPGGVPQD